MNMKNIEILTKIAAIEKMKEKKLPYLLGRAISKNLEKFKEESELIDKERKKICVKYAKKDAEGNPVTEGNKYVLIDEVICNQELNELFETEIDIDINMVTIDTVSKCDEKEFDTLTIEESGTIDFMIE